MKRVFSSFIICIVLIIAGCGTKEQPKISGATTGNSVDNVTEVLSVEQRENLAPNFSWKDASGKTMSLESYRGNVMFINFWATWCGPCLHELPDLVALSKEFSDKKVTFIGVSVDRGSNIIEDVRAFVKEKGVPYQNVLANDDLVAAYGNVNAIPVSFLIDTEGKIVQRYIGIRSKSFLSTSILALLK